MTTAIDNFGVHMLPMVLQTDDLARMYRLFMRIPKGLEPIAEIFKDHVESEGNKLVKEVTEAVEAKKEKDASESPFINCVQRSKLTMLRKFFETTGKWGVHLDLVAAISCRA